MPGKHVLFLTQKYLKILELINHLRVITFTIRCQNKSCSLLSWVLVRSWRHFIFLVNFLNVWKKSYDMENSLNESKMFCRSKLILQDCTYQNTKNCCKVFKYGVSVADFLKGVFSDPHCCKRVNDFLWVFLF